MLERIIEWSATHKLVVGIGTLGLVLAGVWAMLNTPVDAIPDLSDAQVIVMTEWPGQGPQIVEDQVTYPLETELLKVPKIKFVRGMSQFGLSAVYVVFEDGTDLYWARSRVLEYLNGVSAKLPKGTSPVLGPDATGVGWVMQYVLADTSGTLNLGDLRALQDFTVRPALTAVPGVAEIASFGGYQKEYQVSVDPAKLLAYNLPIQKVTDAVRASNADVGGRVLEMNGSEYVVRGRGRFNSLDDIRNVAIGTGPGGSPITVGDVGTVEIGPGLRRGIADLNGKGEVVTGWVVMRYGANPLAVIDAVKKKMTEMEGALPKGVRFVQGYDRSGLIERAIETLKGKLLEESIIVAIVTIIFLLHAESALVAIITLPIGILMALLAMRIIGLNANIMSLGGIAIAIGAMIDAAIVMVENLHKHMERNNAEGAPKNHWTLVIESAQEVGPSLFISLLIITASFLPVFALQDQEGRLFKPLAWTKTLSMASAALLSITLVPVAMGLFVRKGVRPEASNPVNRVLIRAYRPVIEFVLRHRWPTIAAAGVLLAVTWYPWSRIGSEFMPPLNEGSFMDMPSLFPGVGASQAKLIVQQRDAALARIPEVETVMGKIGRAESATDMAPLSMIETIAILKDKKDWRRGVSYDSIVTEANNTVKTPGVGNMWSMPIKNRLDMLATGIKTPVGIKIFGPDLAVLDRIGRQIEGILPAVPGTNTVFAERTVGGRYLDVVIDRAAASRYGMTADEVQMALATAVGGMDAGQVIEGRERYNVLVRYPRELRDDPEKLGAILVATPAGSQVALSHADQVGERVPEQHRVRGRAGPRHRKLRERGQAAPRRKTQPSCRIPAGVVGTVRITGASQGAPENRGSDHPRHHLRAPLLQLPQRHGERDRDALPAVRSGRWGVADVAPWLQHERRRCHRVHSPGRRRRGDGRDHADLSRSRVPCARGRRDAHLAGRHRCRGGAWGGGACAAEDDDCGRDHGGLDSDSLEPGRRRGRPQAHRGTDGGWNAYQHGADARGDSIDLLIVEGALAREGSCLRRLTLRGSHGARSIVLAC
jgi:Cu(I)/Ag(I) efflux system membrane protein CusA/SilA